MIMNVADALEQRRAIKHFDPDHVLTDGEIEELMSLTLRAPTAFNIQNWRFVRVTDPK